MEALIKRGTLRIVDVIIWECHPWAGDCEQLEASIRKANPKPIPAKEHDSVAAGRGYDSASTPEHLKPLDPRLGIEGVERARVSGSCVPVPAYTNAPRTTRRTRTLPSDT